MGASSERESLKRRARAAKDELWPRNRMQHGGAKGHLGLSRSVQQQKMALALKRCVRRDTSSAETMGSLPAQSYTSRRLLRVKKSRKCERRGGACSSSSI